VLAGNISHPPAQMDTATWKIRIFQTVSIEETTNMKVVDPNKLWNFLVYTFFIWNHIVNENQIWISQIWNSNFVKDLKWKNSQHESCRSKEVKKLCSWQVFNLNPFSASKNRFTLGVV
jgi:hypothetical protein